MTDRAPAPSLDLETGGSRVSDAGTGPGAADISEERTRKRSRQYLRSTWRATSRQFAGLLVLQWIGAVVLASVASAQAWAGAESAVGGYVLTAVLVGGLISVPPAVAGWFQPSARATRHAVGAAQLLMSGLLIYLVAGRISMHFHIFVSLAFLALYYDWSVLITAGLVTAVDHFARGILWPMSMFGVTYSAEWMAAEHTAWVIFEVAFLALGCLRAVRAKRARAKMELENEAQNDTLEDLCSNLEEAQREAQEKREEAAHAAETAEEISGFLRSEIEDLDGRIERLSGGDLTVSFVGEGAAPSSHKADEAARMTGQLRAKLEEAVQSIRTTLANVASATREADVSASQISSSADQMAASAEEQSTQAEEVAAAVEQLNQTIGQNAESVQSVAEAAETTGREARRGGKTVQEATDKMERTAAAVQETASVIERLGAYGEKIGQVVERIDEIAQQTNLLALNAAIEAARAGEEGKGFAVVAEEVRELAEEADAATTEIAGMIEQVRADIDEAVGAARQSSQQAEEGLALAEEAGESVEAVVGSIAEVEERVGEIAAASEEQSTTSEQIARSVQSMSTAARESAAGVTQVSDAAGDLDRLTGRLEESVRVFELGGKAGSVRDDDTEEPRAGDASTVGDPPTTDGDPQVGGAPVEDADSGEPVAGAISAEHAGDGPPVDNPLP